MEKTNLLFIGGVFIKKDEQEIIGKSRNNVQLAANNFQWDLINGFDDQLSSPVTIINQMFVGSYPRNYKDWFIKESEFSHKERAKDINLGFVNISILKHLMRPFHEKKYIRRWLQNYPDNNAVFIYSLNNRFVRISRYIKKISPRTPIIISVMDLPEHIMKSKDNNLANIWKKYNSNKVYKGLDFIDCFMVVAEKQIERIKKSKSDCVLVEAITNSRNRDFIPITYTKVKKVVYAGTLAKQYNILDLVQAFLQLSDINAELCICGDGDAKEDIIKASQINSRIKYLGILSKENVNTLMREAWVLVNPRRKGQDFTNFSFPSKTIEYLLSGRPVICQKLEAIPNEYDNYLIYFENSTNNIDLSKKLREVLNYDIHKVNKIGISNYIFASEDKSSKNQIEKILKLIKKSQNKLGNNKNS